MAQAIAAVLLPAVGIASSPIPIVAIILILCTPRARINGPLFPLGWVIGLTALLAAVLALGSVLDRTSSGASGSPLIPAILGLLLLFFAWRRGGAARVPARPGPCRTG